MTISRKSTRVGRSAYLAVVIVALLAALPVGAQVPAEPPVPPDTIRPPAPDTVIAEIRDTLAVTSDTSALRPARPQLMGHTVDGDAVVRWRLQQLQGAPTHGFMVRSTSSVLASLGGEESRYSVLRPVSQLVINSAMPLSMNDGPLWAGQGVNSITTAGVRFSAGPLRVVLAPQFVLSANSDWNVRDTTLWWSPDPAPGRVGRDYTLSWYQGRFSIDLPLRFGNGARAFLDPGQSSIYVNPGPIELGAATENNWWGPGIRNALVLSNNAPGFLHLFVRSAAPWRTAVGSFEWRWLAGALEESEYFDTNPDNDTRSLAALAVVLQPRFSANLTVGATRSVMANAAGHGAALGRWFDVFRRTGRSEPALTWDDTTTTGGREHIIALFARYVMPGAGAEVYGEWGRTALASGRDLLIAPNHTQGYTLGMQWSRPLRSEESRLQVQAEVTTVEQGATFRDRPVGTWYASRRVVQGYTHRGEMLGAAIGPGSSAQWLAVDYFTPRSSIGGYVGRTRWNEDIRSVVEWPDYMQYCNHDVSTYFGVRGSRPGPWGTVAADFSYAKRINSFFQVASCFSPGRRDLGNATLRLTIVPKL